MPVVDIVRKIKSILDLDAMPLEMGLMRLGFAFFHFPLKGW